MDIAYLLARVDDIYADFKKHLDDGHSWSYTVRLCKIGFYTIEELQKADGRFVWLKRRYLIIKNKSYYISEFDKKWGIDETNVHLMGNEQQLKSIRFKPKEPDVTLPTTKVVDPNSKVHPKDSPSRNQNYGSTIPGRFAKDEKRGCPTF